MAAHGNAILRQRQLLAGSDAELPLDEVETGDFFGDRMLDLQARIHLDEMPWRVGLEPAAFDQELDRACALVADSFCERDGGGGHLRTQRLRHARCRRFLDHLLVAPLQGAVALEEMHGVAVRIAENLHLDVARRDDQLLHQHTRVTEGALRLALRALERGGKILRALDQTHATPAATSHCLDHQRIADAVCLAKQGFQILSVAVIAGHHRHTRGPCDGFGSRLAAELAHRLAGWADELDAGLGAGVGKVGILGQEAIARVNGIRARVLRRR